MGRPKEIDWQTKLVKRIRNEDGHAQKMGSVMASSTLDLIGSLPGLGAFLVECKMEHVERDKWGFRTLKVTEKQKIEIYRWYCGGATVRVICFVRYSPAEVYLVSFKPKIPPNDYVIMPVMEERALLWRNSNDTIKNLIMERSL